MHRCIMPSRRPGFGRGLCSRCLGGASHNNSLGSISEITLSVSVQCRLLLPAQAFLIFPLTFFSFSVCLSVSLSACVFVLSVCLSVSACVFVLSLSLCPSVCLSVSEFVFYSVSLFYSLSSCVLLCLSLCVCASAPLPLLSVSVCLSLSVSVCLSLFYSLRVVHSPRSLSVCMCFTMHVFYSFLNNKNIKQHSPPPLLLRAKYFCAFSLSSNFCQSVSVLLPPYPPTPPPSSANAGCTLHLFVRHDHS